jgi:glycosyltransferase involved in cell wall biosynthesis
MNQPALGIVIPIYKHAGLVSETILFALNQVSNFDYVIALVNDGCPFAETDEVCRQFAATYPNRIFYVRKPNGGLSSARNAGISVLLNAFPSIEAIYLMDADNRIGPHLLQKCLDLLLASPPEVGWVYPDIDKFGIEEFCDVSGPYKPIEHLMMNICEAGSMVRRTVLDSGIRFDEKMLKGYEDWEFWLQCLDGGFRGVHCPAIGFRYRQRGESMVRDSERFHAEIMGYIHTKHKRLFSFDTIMRMEEDTFKRYAIFLSGVQDVVYTTDPHHKMPAVIYQSFAQTFFQNERKPELGAVPGYIACTSREYLDLLNTLGLLHGLFWQMQQMLDNANLVALHIDFAPGKVTEIEVDHILSRPDSAPALVFSRTALLRECMHDPTTNWIAKPRPV